MRKNNKNLFESGFTLPEILIGAGILGIISLGISKMGSTLLKSSRGSSQNMSVNSLRINIFKAMQDKSSCDRTFQNIEFMDGATTQVPAIYSSLSSSIGSVTISEIVSLGQVFEVQGSERDQKSRITISNITISDYEASGAPFRSDPTLPLPDRQLAKSKLVVTYQRGDRTGGASDGLEISRTSGAAVGRMTFPIVVALNSADNTFAGCNTEENTFTEAFCQSIQGISFTDGYCRHVTLEDDITEITNPENNQAADSWAARFLGDFLIQTSDVNENENDLRVAGSVDIGIWDGSVPAPSAIVDYNGEGGYLNVARSISVGTSEPPNTVTMGIDGGVGLFDNSITVGNLDPVLNTQQGKFRIESNLIVGSDSFAGAAIYTNGSGLGNAAFKGSFSLGESSLNSAISDENGHVYIDDSLTVGVGVEPISTTSKGSVVAKGIIVQAARGNENYPSEDDQDGNNGSIRIEGHAHLPNQSISESWNTGEGTRAATMGWVAERIAQSITPGVASAKIGDVYEDILTNNSQSSVAFEAVCNGVSLRRSGGSSYYSGSDIVSGNLCGVEIGHCSEAGNCDGLYAESGGLVSEGSIVSENGDIRAESGIGDIKGSASAGLAADAPRITARQDICIGGNFCKTEWADILIGTLSCGTWTTSQCSSGSFIGQVRMAETSVTYVTSISDVYSNSVGRYILGTVGTNTRGIGTGIEFRCCEAVNED